MLSDFPDVNLVAARLHDSEKCPEDPAYYLLSEDEKDAVRSAVWSVYVAIEEVKQQGKALGAAIDLPRGE